MCDLHDVYPQDFRAEKLTAHQVGSLERLGLWRTLHPIATPIDTLSIARFGRIVERRPNREYGIDYADLVNAIRADVPSDRIVVKRVARIEASSAGQSIVLGDGARIGARLAVVATGLGRGLLEGVGVRRVAQEDNHCLAIGFDLAVGREAARRIALTYYGERVADRSAYLTLFPIADRLRANLFVYRRRDETWAREFRERPVEMLLAMMPGLVPLLGDVQVVGKAVLRPIDLYASEGHLRDGVVLIGDAFSTTCPTGGTGMDKVLTDVETLVRLVPGWLSTSGMARPKIACFYDDLVKRACDANARRMIDYAKGMALNSGLAWSARRYRNFVVQRLRDRLRRGLTHATRGA